MVEIRDCIPIVDIAKRNGKSTRCIKRRLLKAHRRREAERPDSPPLLTQFAPGGHWFANRVVLQQVAPGLLDGGHEVRLARIEATLTHLADGLARVEAKVDELLDTSVTIRARVVELTR